MVHSIVQSIGMILGGTAMLLTFAVCGMPHWRVSIVAESTEYGKRVDGLWISRWDGLWLTCVRQSGLPMSCHSYSAPMSLTPDLKLARVLMSFAVMTSIFGFLSGLFGMLFNCFFEKNPRTRRCLLLIAGISYIIAGFLVLLPVTIVAYNILKEVCFSYCKSVQQQEIGEAVMLGWPTVLMFFIGGAIFCWYHSSVCTERGCGCLFKESHSKPDPEPYSEELQVFQITSIKRDDLTI
ncbi:claudin-8-like [Gastrophryne carolinensis]